MKLSLVAFIVTLCMTSSAFAVQYCTIKGTDNQVGIFPGDSSRPASIYIEGQGYFRLTDVDYANEVYVSKKRGRDPIVLDFKNRILQIEDQNLKLVKCVQNGSE